MASEDSTPRYKVTDRRTVRDPADEPHPDAAAEATPEGDAPQPAPEEPEDAGEEAQAHSPAPITFSTFVLSLGTSALVHLGEMEDPAARGTRVDLALARQTIDILGILEEKTRGNLLREEEGLLRNLLTDLRMRFVYSRRSN